MADWRPSLKKAVTEHGPKAMIYAANAETLNFDSHELLCMRPVERTALDRVIEAAHKASEAAFLDHAARQARLKK